MEAVIAETLIGHLKRSTREAFDYLRKQGEEVTPEEARLYSSVNWPTHKFGIGQDGSISGIVYHVTAWKWLTLPLLSEGGTVREMSAFRAIEKPPIEKYAEVWKWFLEVGEAWNTALDHLPEEALTQTLEWGAETVTVAQYIEEMRMHDIQHAAQIEYLKGRILFDEEEKERTRLL